MRRIPAFLLVALSLVASATLAWGAATPIKIILIGDSITRGDGYTFRYHLWNKLLDHGYTDIDFVGTTPSIYHGGFDEDCRATGGFTAAQLLAAAKSDIATFKPDIAVIHAGSMDSYKMSIGPAENVPAAVTACRDSVKAIIADLRAANPAVKIILPKFSLQSDKAPFCQRVSEAYVQLAAESSTAESPVAIVDLVTGFNYDDSVDAYDKNHLNNSGAIKVADRLYPVLASWLTRGTPRVRATPKEGPNLARNSGVLASASRSLTDATFAIDGDLLTSWCSAPYVPGGKSPLPTTDWLELDLGQASNLKGSAIYWDVNGRKYGYTIQTRATTSDAWTLSVDASRATTYAESMRGQVDYFNAPNTRYVRLTVTNLGNDESWTLWPAQVAEFRVFAETTEASANVSAPWVSLFNGQDLSGWMIKGDPAGKVRVADGQINCQQTAQTKEHTFVCTEAMYGDYIFEADVKIDGAFNSGILFRCVDMPKGAHPSIPGRSEPSALNGYQVKIDPTPRKWTGGIFDDFGPDFKWYYSLEKDPRAQAAFKLEAWNTFRIEAIGNNLKVWVNGVPTTHMTHGKYTTGRIAFKIHSLVNLPELPGVLGHFKNIRIITEKPAAYAQTMDLPAQAID